MCYSISLFLHISIFPPCVSFLSPHLPPAFPLSVNLYDTQFHGELIDRHEFERIWLMSSEMITLHEPQLVQTIQKVIAQRHLNLNEFVTKAVQHYLEVM